MEDPHPKPSGTFAVLLIYAFLIVVLWGSVYLVLLLRGSGQ